MFVTMDFEIADRILPSICSIAIITWEDGQIIDTFHSLVDPDCEVEEFMGLKHGMDNTFLLDAPPITELWVPIFDRLEHKTVFCFNPNQAFRAMMHKAEIEQLNMPNLNYGSVQSICKRTWKGLDDYSLPSISEKLNITKIHNNALEDAITLGKIIYKASDEMELNNPYGLFKKIGFAGGKIRNGIKLPYRAVKSKDKQFYIAKLSAENIFNNDLETK